MKIYKHIPIMCDYYDGNKDKAIKYFKYFKKMARYANSIVIPKNLFNFKYKNCNGFEDYIEEEDFD